MQFAVAATALWESKGFDVTDWRKSVDETQALVHLEFAEILVPNLKWYISRGYVRVYNHDEETFTELLSSPVWMPPDTEGG